MPLLDTDTCVFWLRGNKLVRQRLQSVGWAKAAVSVITLAELYYGAHKSARPELNLLKVREFTKRPRVIPVTEDVLLRFAETKSALERQGERLEDFDLMIAATALAEGSILVTHNTRHFQRIPGLTLEDWSIPE